MAASGSYTWSTGDIITSSPATLAAFLAIAAPFCDDFSFSSRFSFFLLFTPFFHTVSLLPGRQNFLRLGNLLLRLFHVVKT